MAELEDPDDLVVTDSPDHKKRPDVAARLKARKHFDERVIKCRLLSLLANNKNKLSIALSDRVRGFSERIHIASLSLNLLIRELFHDVPTCVLYAVDVPDLFDQTFIRQLIVGPDSAEKPAPDIQSLFENYPHLKKRLDAIDRHTYDLNIMTFGAKKFLTNLKNHYTTQITKWIKKWVYSDYVKMQLGKLTKEQYQKTTTVLLYDLHNWKMPSDLKNAPHILESLPRRVKQYYRIQKLILGSDTLGAAWLKKSESFARMLKYAVFMNRFINATAYIPKLLALTPICRIKNHYITLDRVGLRGLLTDARIVETFPEELDEKWASEMWRKILKIQKLEKGIKVFTNTVETDGVSICVHMKRPKACKETNSECQERLKAALKDPSLVVLGVDPGRCNILYAAIPDPTEERKFHGMRLTRNQYYQQSGVWKAQEQTLSWQKPIQKELDQLSRVSTKGDSLWGILEYLDVWMRVEKKLRAVYCHDKWSNQRLRLYGGKKRTFSEYFNDIESKVKSLYGTGAKILIAYGSATFAPGGKSEVSVPTARAYRECEARFWTQYVDEFRTTALWWEDPNVELKKVMRADRKEEVRGLHWCSSTNVKGKLVNRDLNAAINIRNCLVRERHANMKRSRKLPKLKKQIGRWLLH